MSVHSFLPISLVYLSHSVFEVINDSQIDRFALVHSIMLLAAPFKLQLDILHLLKEANEDKPLSELTRLLDTLLSILYTLLLDILQYVSLDQVPILELLFLEIFIFSAQADLFTLLLLLLLLVSEQSVAQLVLFAELME